LVSQEIGGVRGGGIGTYVVETGKALQGAGHETWLVTRSAGLSKARELESVPGFDRVILTDRHKTSRRLPHFRNGEPHYGYSTLVFLTLQELGVDFDYIEFADYRAEGLVTLQEQRCFRTFDRTVLGVTLHTPSWESWMADRQAHRTGLAVHELCALEDEAIRIAPLLQCPSVALAQEVRDRLALDRQIRILRYPMDLSAEPPPAPRSGRAVQDLSFLYYGRLEPRKGVIELVEAFRQLPHLSLRVIGADTPLSSWGTSVRSDLERSLPKNVEILDPVDRDKLLGNLARVDVCLFPSTFENWPNVCLEAMGAARVVVGGKHGGMAEMIENEVNGFLVEGGSSTAIVRLLSKVLPRHLDRLEELGNGAALRARELSNPDRFSEQLVRNVEAVRSRMTRQANTSSADSKVSVVIPFDRKRDVQSSLESVHRQSHRNIELILVADAEAETRASRIADGSSRNGVPARVLVPRVGTPGAKRNCGIRNTGEEYILFLEPHECLSAEAVELGLECLQRNPSSGFAAPQVTETGPSSARRPHIRNPLQFDRSIALLGNRFGTGGALFRRSLFRDNGVEYDEILRSELELALWMDIDRRGVVGERIPRPLCETRGGAGSATSVQLLSEHSANMGLIIERHWNASSQLEHRALTAVFATAGAAIAGTAGDHRIEAADTFADLARRAPHLTAALLHFLGWLRAAAARRHGGSA
jgi:glycosyltransferase involved in cell wall biosynthesis